MSTVLWSNLLIDGKVISDESDKPALHKHADKLDAIAKRLTLPSFLSICDTTDVRFNLGAFDLPEGVDSTDDVMALEGAWIPVHDAVRLLAGVLEYVERQRVRFGLLSNDYDRVVEELAEALMHARRATAHDAKFNFSIVT